MALQSDQRAEFDVPALRLFDIAVRIDPEAWDSPTDYADEADKTWHLSLVAPNIAGL